ncbi:MAG TPA: ATP-grasp domain-containing protein [Actinomycetota bacterium]|nr:ATP-grasp domain-containing protein [Actinomycetota bacterium]
MSSRHDRVAAIDVGDSARLPVPVWRDIVDFCARHDVEMTSVPTGAGPAVLDATIRKLAGVDAIAVFACPDPNTRLAREVLAGVLGTQSVVGLDELLDKRRTRALCRRLGIPVPDGLEGPGRQIAERAAELLARTGRVVVKDPAGHGGLGVTAVTDRAELLRALAGDETVVVEAFLEGEEFSVEAVCGPSGVQFVGWLAKGRTGDSEHPLTRVRYAPVETVPETLRAPCERLLRATGYHGIAEVEMVVAYGRAYMLECNPRTSGVTPVLHFSGRGSSSLRLVADLCGAPQPGGPVTAAADFPLTDREAWPADPRAHCARPPALYETRVFMWGEPTDLQERLARQDPSRGASLADRVRAADALLAGESMPTAS